MLLESKACFAKSDPKWLREKVAEVILSKTVRTPENILREGLSTIPSGPEVLVRRQKKFRSSSKGGLSKVAEDLSITPKPLTIDSAMTSSKKLFNKVKSNKVSGLAASGVNAIIGKEPLEQSLSRATLNRVAVNRMAKSKEYKTMPISQQKDVDKAVSLYSKGEKTVRDFAEKPSVWGVKKVIGTIAKDKPEAERIIGGLKESYPKQMNFIDSTLQARGWTVKPASSWK